MAYDVNAMTQLIRSEAAKRGINPDIAVRVAKSEGLGRGVWQSNVMKNGVREPSYGPFQMLVGGQGTGFPTGMGNAFMRDTGLDPRDPKNANATVGYALDVAAKEGWGQWYGPKHVGIGRYDGIQGAKPVGGNYQPSPYANMPDGPKGEEVYSTPATSGGDTMVAGGGGILAGAGESSGAIDPSLLKDKNEKSPLAGLFDALAQYPNAQPSRMSQFADARQSGGSLLEALANPNPYTQLARKNRGLLG